MKKIDFIAEVSSNHNRDLNRMIDFIHATKDSGCTGVKFQLFKIDELFAPEIIKNNESVRSRKNWELQENYIPRLAQEAHKLNLSFSCTPFYLNAVDILKDHVDFLKIASYELLWLDLFKKCAHTGLPVVFSTGMATLEEVEDSLQYLLKSNCKEITILHCNSAYPTKIHDANLSGINTLKEIAKSINQKKCTTVKIGYSDHTVSPAVIYRAIHKYNVKLIEFHLDLDGKGDEYAAGHCWLPNQIKDVISTVNDGFRADGNSIIGPSPSEISDREWRADPVDGLRPLKNGRANFED